MSRLRCSKLGCLSIRDEAPRREGEDAGLCARHRQEDRQRRGVCLNCGAGMAEQPEENLLTGRPLRRDGVEVSVFRCSASCGYQRRPRQRARRRTS